MHVTPACVVAQPGEVAVSAKGADTVPGVTPVAEVATSVNVIDWVFVVTSWGRRVLDEVVAPFGTVIESVAEE